MMHFDFAALLVILTALAGAIWGLDRAFLASKRRANHGAAAEPKPVEYARSFFPVLLIVLVIRSFVAEPFRIPSSSMVPTLLIGDLILVNKFSYGLRLPVLDTKILDLGEPQRGDVVVFRFPANPSQDYIKRIIGLPGDVVEYREKRLSINGEAVALDELGPYQALDGEQPGMELLTERLPGRDHEILHRPTPGGLGEGRWVIEEGEYFVLGDNRDNSQDSRFWGVVPEENLVGKAFLIWMRLSKTDWNRIGTIIN